MHSNTDHVCSPHSFWAGAAPDISAAKFGAVQLIMMPFGFQGGERAGEQVNVRLQTK